MPLIPTSNQFSTTLQPDVSSHQGNRLLPAVVLTVVILATLAAYSPVFFNFFSGDDFVHLTWLTQAVKQPELIWRNFHSSWLDGTTTQFYRPLISVFMVGDYLLWGLNGLGFRFTNIICHLLSACFLYLILAKLDPSKSKDTSWWALSSAALFALYPLHPEAVSWITGRVDTIVTTFILASFWSYLAWRQAAIQQRKSSLCWLVTSLVNMTLALLSKEMAITLPALFFAYEFIHARTTFSISPKSVFWRGLSALKTTACFWLLLLAYFGVRRLALGTFVGGYDDSLFFVANMRTFLSSWIQGLRMFFIPLNKELLGSHHILTRAWEVFLAATAFLGIVSAWQKSQLRATLVFVLLWLGLSLLPVYKIFTIASDLQGSRLAYLATVPLCALLTFSLLNFARPAWMKYLSRLSVTCLIACAGLVLWVNNQAWAHAGNESNAIRADLSKLYQQLKGDPQVLLLGLPDQIEGAYISRNALWGMLKKPQLERDIYNCLMVNSFEPILPFGYLRQSIQDSVEQVQIFAWHTDSQKFRPLKLPTNTTSLRQLWQAHTLPEVLRPSPQANIRWQLPRGLEVTGSAGLRGRPELYLQINNRPGWSIDFIAVKVKLLDKAGAGSRVGADLLYANDLDPKFALIKRTHYDLQPQADHQTLIFPLHSLPEWALGGQTRGFKLLLPENCHLLLESVAIVAADDIMPSVHFADSGFLGSKGFVHISKSAPQQEILIRSDNVAAATATQLELTRANLFFESQNTKDASRVQLKTFHINSTNGRFQLRRDMFPAAGIYELRPWALNSRGEIQGVCGDHIVIAVDS